MKEIILNKSDRIKSKEIPSYLAQYKPFICGSARGSLDHCMGANGKEEVIYLLWSYNTKIAEVNTRNGELMYYDPTFYSATTKRLQNAIVETFGAVD